jgi:hypothetical protein
VIAGVALLLCLSGAPQDTTLDGVLRRAFMQGPESGMRAFASARGARPRSVTPSLLIDVAKDLVTQGDTGAAVAALELNATEFPEAAAAADALGHVLVAVGRLEEAAAAYRRSLAIDIYNPDTGKRLDWIDGLLAAQREPMVVPDSILRAYGGTYGPYDIEFKRGWLTVRAAEVARSPLLPLSNGLFAVEGVPTLRLWFVRAADGSYQRLVTLHFGAAGQVWPRENR